MTTMAAPASTLEARAPDASKHVNYNLGMVLGVDDFNQEFAYLIGRSRWLARDAIGYGTLNGLHVAWDKVASKGPRVTVTTGTALTPRGQLVCVKPAQCAFLNEWLAANKEAVDALLASPLASPLSSTVSLYLTLCYRDCPVDLVPIPGEPCRTEDELLKPSRLVDDFVLDLRTTAPDQAEEDLLREFVAWLRTLSFGGGGSYLTAEAFGDALRAAVQIGGTSLASPLASPLSPLSPLSSPPSGPSVHFNFGSPATGLSLDPLLAPDYYRVAFRIWIEEIRPWVHAVCCGGGGCCGQGAQPPKPDECLLLARLDVPVLLSSGKWVVDDTRDVGIDESRRPMLVHLRLLQELAGGSVGAGLGGARLAAAGIVKVVGAARQPVLNNLALTKISDEQVKLTFGGYISPASPLAGVQYVVKALPLTSATVKNPLIIVHDFASDGIVLRLVSGTNGNAFGAGQIDSLELSVEVTRIG